MSGCVEMWVPCGHVGSRHGQVVRLAWLHWEVGVVGRELCG